VHKLAAATGYSDDDDDQWPQEVLRDGAAAAGAQRQRYCTAGADRSGEKNALQQQQTLKLGQKINTHSAS